MTTTAVGNMPGRTSHVSQQPLPGIADAEQFRTIGEAARRAKAGDTVIIHGGTYREHVVIEASGTAEHPIRFIAATGERVVITGADEITEWERVDAERHIYRTPWPRVFTSRTSLTHPGDDYHLLIGRAEQVITDGYLLRQVLSRDKLSRGSFYVDLDAKLLYAWGYSNEPFDGRVRIEASTRPTLWESRGAHIHLRGLRFRYAANHAQMGAAQFRGDHGVTEDCIFERTNASGASFTASHITARRCTFQDNGQLGFGGGRPHHLLLTECLCRNNNTKKYYRHWEAGGNKIALARNVVFERSVFVENRGSGIWFDIGNEDCVVRNCLIADNEECGIFYEISYRLHAHDNVIIGNGFTGTPAAGGLLCGIAVANSPGCVIERNLIVGNRSGINYRENPRETWLIDDRTDRPVWSHDEDIHHNVLAYNQAAQTWGQFETDDQRHWPVAMQELPIPDGDGRQPVGLSLEKLNLGHHDNLYWAAPGQGILIWGHPRRRHKQYDTVDDVRAELNLEHGTELVDPAFADPLTRDFRVLADSRLLKEGCYPQGDVPGVKLGIIGK
ncbi:MAG: right-handed parallel beta-helix repeat-containing protein [Armatimonadota bacterium]